MAPYYVSQDEVATCYNKEEIWNKVNAATNTKEVIVAWFLTVPETEECLFAEAKWLELAKKEYALANGPCEKWSALRYFPPQERHVFRLAYYREFLDGPENCSIDQELRYEIEQASNEFQFITLKVRTGRDYRHLENIVERKWDEYSLGQIKAATGLCDLAWAVKNSRSRSEVQRLGLIKLRRLIDEQKTQE